MSSVRTVLACLDDSPRAGGVLEMARDVADRFGARLHLFRVIVVDLPHPPAAHANPDDIPTFLVRETEESLRSFARQVPGDVVEKPVLSSREPWQDILERARAIHADLIVIGSHNLHGWDRILRTNTARIAERAEQHVLVVHSDHS